MAEEVTVAKGVTTPGAFFEGETNIPFSKSRIVVGFRKLRGSSCIGTVFGEELTVEGEGIVGEA